MTNHRTALSLSNILTLALVFGSVTSVSVGVSRATAVSVERAPSAAVILDSVVVGVSGHASIKAAPATWSSRAEVRQAARWGTSGKYLV